jgi:hypothetical protein
MRRVLGAAGLLGAVRDPATEEVRTRRVIAARALAEIDRLVLEGRLGEAAADRLRSPYRREVAPSPEVDAADVREAERQLIAVERDALHEAVHDGLASASVVARLQGELAARREAQGRED